MKQLISIAGLLIAAVVAIAATTHTTTTRSTGTRPPTTASLTNAYVEAAQYWQNRPSLRRERPAGHTADDRLAHERVRGGREVLAARKRRALRPTD